MSRSLLAITLLLVLSIVTPFPLAAADAEAPNRQFTAARGLEVDSDFAFQGEYFGEIQAVCGTPVPFGIQVVALGGRQFSARGYRGGLPGNGWNGDEPITWIGQRNQEALVVKGPRGRVIIRADLATVVDTANRVVGNVPKIRRVSRSMGAIPPLGATILFDGSDTEQFEGGEITPEGWLIAGAVTRLPVQDFHLHLEFKVPYMPYATDQARSNSGVYIQRRYEVQILDSFGLAPVFNGCGALYRQQMADLNMSFPPLAWQTYDILFNAARWDEEGKKIADARITVRHNGVVIHDNRTVPTKTGAGKAEGPDALPILLQNHGNPVHFRNIWLVDKRPPANIPPGAPSPAGLTTSVIDHAACPWTIVSPGFETIHMPNCQSRGWVIWKGI